MKSLVPPAWAIPPGRHRSLFRVVTKFFVFQYVLPTIVDGDYLQQRRWKQSIIQEYKIIGNGCCGCRQIHKWIDVSWYENCLEACGDTNDPGPR
jgi:hypothetical protein